MEASCLSFEVKSMEARVFSSLRLLKEVKFWKEKKEKKGEPTTAHVH